MNKDFKKNKYCLVKKVLSDEIINFMFDYLIQKRTVAKILFFKNYISPFEKMHGTFGDPQVKDAYSIYGDVAVDLMLLKLQKIMEKNTGKKLYPTYSYSRVYKKGNVLEKHVDRPSCEISATLNWGGDLWPIFIKSNNKDVKIDLHPGDILIYKGEELEHWREPFNKKLCVQSFLHYNDMNNHYRNNFNDNRPALGLPKDI